MDSATRTHGGREDREKGDNEKNNESSSSPSSSSIGSELNKLAHTAKSGWRPLVKYLYETRGIAYRDGVKEFIKEYKIGYREAIESERKNSSSENGDIDCDDNALSSQPTLTLMEKQYLYFYCIMVPVPLPGINSLLLLEDVTHKILEPLRI